MKSTQYHFLSLGIYEIKIVVLYVLDLIYPFSMYIS